MNDEVFVRTPAALLELFVLLQQNPEIKGVRAVDDSRGRPRASG